MNAVNEHIVLQSDAVETSALILPPEAQRQIDFDYQLKPKFSAHTYHFQLFNQCYLQIQKQDKQSKTVSQIAFHIGLLEPAAKKQRSTAWLTFTAALLTAVAAVTLGVVLKDYWLALSTAGLSGLLFLVHYFSFRESSFFLSRSGKAALIKLNHRCQCRRSLKAFISQLESRIESNKLPVSSKYFAEENKWHRQLNEQGWLSDENYQKARVRILKQFNKAKA